MSLCRCCDPQAVTAATCELCAKMNAQEAETRRRLAAYKDSLYRLIELHVSHHEKVTAAVLSPIEDRIRERKLRRRG